MIQVIKISRSLPSGIAETIAVISTTFRIHARKNSDTGGSKRESRQTLPEIGFQRGRGLSFGDSGPGVVQVRTGGVRHILQGIAKKSYGNLLFRRRSSVRTGGSIAPGDATPPIFPEEREMSTEEFQNSKTPFYASSIGDFGKFALPARTETAIQYLQSDKPF